MSERITPTCRYHEGTPLVRQDVDGIQQFYAAESFPRKFVGPNQYYMYSFLVYKCPLCSYIELHDEGQE